MQVNGTSVYGRVGDKGSDGLKGQDCAAPLCPCCHTDIYTKLMDSGFDQCCKFSQRYDYSSNVFVWDGTQLWGAPW